MDIQHFSLILLIGYFSFTAAEPLYSKKQIPEITENQEIEDVKIRRIETTKLRHGRNWGQMPYSVLYLKPAFTMSRKLLFTQPEMKPETSKVTISSLRFPHSVFPKMFVFRSWNAGKPN
ncbi:hypothetical protein HHI36_010642 [Cryptolaemus montrouzieri]|uniref:Uncharacterized protein n=1 Tax=Cryptolaemus montrouzieri TaxID=559131 RepID=A0ABD2MJP7_9CUCU